MTAAFWAGAAALAIIVVWMLLPSLLGKRAGAAVEAAAPVRANLDVLRQQRTQLDADLAVGTLSPEQHRAALEDIERRVLEEEGQSAAAAAAAAPVAAGPSRVTGWALGIALPVLAVALYLKLGQPQALKPEAASPPAAAASGNQITAEDVMAMIDQLNKRMAEKPDDLQGWLMLARANAALQRYDDASRAFAKAAQLQPNDAQLLADQADALAMAQGGTALGEPTRLIERALKVDPNNMKALALAGTAAFERQDFPAAERHWSRAAELAPPDSELAKGLAEGLRDARARLAEVGGPAATTGGGSAAPAAGAKATAAASAPGSAPTTAGAAAQVSGRVSLAPAIASRVAPTDTVFIVARAASGPRMPLAVIRKQVSDLPMSFTLDDSMAMAPEMKLSAFPQVVVIARVSKTGSATPAPDDLVVQSAPVAVGSKGLELVIEKTAP